MRALAVVEILALRESTSCRTTCKGDCYADFLPLEAPSKRFTHWRDRRFFLLLFAQFYLISINRRNISRIVVRGVLFAGLKRAAQKLPAFQGPRPGNPGLASPHRQVPAWQCLGMICRSTCRAKAKPHRARKNAKVCSRPLIEEVLSETASRRARLLPVPAVGEYATAAALWSQGPLAGVLRVVGEGLQWRGGADAAAGPGWGTGRAVAQVARHGAGRQLHGWAAARKPWPRPPDEARDRRHAAEFGRRAQGCYRWATNILPREQMSLRRFIRLFCPGVRWRGRHSFPGPGRMNNLFHL